jgi:apolipoprotein D and lipocalin family protein
MKISLRFLLGLSSLLLGTGIATAAPAPLPTVAQVDLKRYMGDWYEWAKLPNRFQAMCTADTLARYRIDGDKVRVENRCRNQDGQIETAQGSAKVVDDSGNAKLRVSFFWPFYGDYWVLAFDESAPDYRWVLVGEPERRYAWVLSRSAQLDAATLDGILAKAAALGFDRRAFQITPHIQPIPLDPKLNPQP